MIAEEEIQHFDTSEFKESLKLYESSFPPNETRPVGKVVEMLKNDENYHLYISLDHNEVVGISLMYAFRSLSIGLLDYLAVDPDYRGSGIGKKLFKFTLEKFKSNTANGVGILIEVQRENVVDVREKNLRERRIWFYTRIGAKIMDGVNYILPPIHDGSSSEEMYLMIRPLGELHWLSKESVLRYIQAIYSTIYQYQEKDLLSIISQKLPARINMVNWNGSSS
jgi:ribosomal protein S18 acetylase RimI-like enzyme